MGNGIEAVSNTQQATRPDRLKRAAITYLPLWQSAGLIFGKELVKGKNIYDAGKQVKEDVGSVHKENIRTAKKVVKTVVEHPEILVIPPIFTLVKLGKKAFNSARN